MSRASYFAALMILACGCTGTQAPREALPVERPAEPPPQESPPSQSPPGTGASCSRDSNGPRPGPQPKIAEGITGVVCFWQGDFMPTIGGPPSGLITPVRRTIEIHAATRDSDATPGGGATFRTSVSTPLIATVTSGDDGWFEVAVPPGTYSLFVRESGSLYANGWDDAGIITPVTVVAGAVARTQFNINYKASE
jgi:hypothetical protein